MVRHVGLFWSQLWLRFATPDCLFWSQLWSRFATPDCRCRQIVPVQGIRVARGLRCHSGDWNQEGDEFDIGVTAAASAARILREAML